MISVVNHVIPLIININVIIHVILVIIHVVLLFSDFIDYDIDDKLHGTI